MYIDHCEIFGINIIYAKLIMQLYSTYSHFLTKHYIFLVNTPNPTATKTQSSHTRHNTHLVFIATLTHHELPDTI